MWSPWRGCHRYSEGCKYCYIHKGDYKRGIDTNVISKSSNFDAPIKKDKTGNYKMKSGQIVYLCFQTDFLIEEGDVWRDECWKMIKERKDLKFLFLTKRIDRFKKCIPDDWNTGYENVIVCCTVENQKQVDYRLPIFNEIKARNKVLTCQPLIENINIEKYLDDINLVVVGGESDINARVINYEWVLNIRNQCIKKSVNFEFRQCGTHFLKDGKMYNLLTKDLCRLAKKANINYKNKI